MRKQPKNSANDNPRPFFDLVMRRLREIRRQRTRSTPRSKRNLDIKHRTATLFFKCR
jgi:hypothetical protein